VCIVYILLLSIVMALSRAGVWWMCIALPAGSHWDRKCTLQQPTASAAFHLYLCTHTSTTPGPYCTFAAAPAASRAELAAVSAARAPKCKANLGFGGGCILVWGPSFVRWSCSRHEQGCCSGCCTSSCQLRTIVLVFVAPAALQVPRSMVTCAALLRERSS
jgi:hypothetical protein